MTKRLGVQIEWLEERILQAEVVGLERDGELLLSAQVRIAALDAASFRPRGMDEAVLAVLQPHLHPESEH